MSYRVFISQTAVDVVARLRGKQKKLLGEFIRDLEEDSFNEGDFLEMDDSGREYFTKIIKNYAVSFYPDHAVKEIKVFEICRADR